MNRFIACCGLDCESCDARIATLTNNNALREKTAAFWTKLNGVTITPEMIHCTGCRIDVAKTPFCDKLCPVHNCVREKGLDITMNINRSLRTVTASFLPMKTENVFFIEKKTVIPSLSHVSMNWKGSCPICMKTIYISFLYR